MEYHYNDTRTFVEKHRERRPDHRSFYLKVKKTADKVK